MTRTRAEIEADIAAKRTELFDLKTDLSLAERIAKPGLNVRIGQLSAELRRLQADAATCAEARQQREDMRDELVAALVVAETALETRDDGDAALETVRAALAKAREVGA